MSATLTTMSDRQSVTSLISRRS